MPKPIKYELTEKGYKYLLENVKTEDSSVRGLLDEMRKNGILASWEQMDINDKFTYKIVFRK